VIDICPGINRPICKIKCQTNDIPKYFRLHKFAGNCILGIWISEDQESYLPETSASFGD
jgi:hypothetical protein